MNRRRFLMLSATLLGTPVGASLPGMCAAKDGGGSGGGDDGGGGSSGSGSGDDGGSSGHGRGGDDGDHSGHGSRGSDDAGSSGGRSGSRDGESRGSDRSGRGNNAVGGRARGPASVDTVSLSYGDCSRESVVGGRYARFDGGGRIAEDRPATRADIARLANANLGGALRGDLLLRMDSRSGAVEIVDRRGWRETMSGSQYSLTDPSGNLVRVRALRPDDLARVRSLLDR